MNVRKLARADTREDSGNTLVLTGVFLAFFFVMSVLSPKIFLSMGTMRSLFVQLPEFGIYAFAMMLAMLTGGIDLSIVSAGKHYCQQLYDLADVSIAGARTAADCSDGFADSVGGGGVLRCIERNLRSRCWNSSYARDIGQYADVQRGIHDSDARLIGTGTSGTILPDWSENSCRHHSDYNAGVSCHCGHSTLHTGLHCTRI